MKKRISIVLVDDNSSMCQSIVGVINAQPDFHLLETLAEIEVALRRVRNTEPEIVLLNLRHVGDDSLALAGALHGAVPKARVIVIGLKPRHVDVASFIRARVFGFIMQDATFDKFLHTIGSVAQGTTVLPPELTRSLFDQLHRHRGVGPLKRTLTIERLTERERAVADLIVQGMSKEKIGRQLELAVHTVNRSIRGVLSKLTVNKQLAVATFSQERLLCRAPTTRTQRSITA
jgi:DNA-binding NarL/FixJ family response regulator